MSLTPHEFVPDRSRLYCSECQLLERNAVHDDALRPATPDAKVDLAYKNYQASEAVFMAARERHAEMTLTWLRECALRDNEAARFLAFTCENTYFGHGQSGPTVNAQLLHDAEGKPLPINGIDSDDEQEHNFDDEGMLYLYFDLTERPEEDDNLVYVLDLETGIYTDDPSPALQEWPEDDDE